MAVHAWVAQPHDGVADWELWLAATAQHHERVSHHKLLAWKRIKIHILLNVYHFGIIVKPTNYKSHY